MKTLYLCYFGVREPLVQTQVIPYLRAIARSGVGVHLLTWEPSGDRGCNRAADRQATRAELARQGIAWHRLRYHRTPSLPATGLDVALGIARAAWLVRRHGIDVLHARSHVPATVALALKRALGCRYVFDLRGLIADEYADTGHWTREGVPFRLTKRVERTLLAEADAVVTLTAQIKEHLFSGGTEGGDRERPIEVIPCCVDLERFQGARAGRDRLRAELGLGAGTVIAYAGGLGGCYLTEEMAAFTAAALEVEPGARLLALSQGAHDLLRRELARRGVPEAAAQIRFVEPSQVPRFLGAADMALSLIQPGFSKTACSPTKVAEYLAAGLPIASNAGIGDIDRVLRADRVGVVLEAMTPAAYRAGFTRLRDWLKEDPEIVDRCRLSARRWFDLASVGEPAYVRLYQELMRA